MLQSYQEEERVTNRHQKSEHVLSASQHCCPVYKEQLDSVLAGALL